MHSIREMKEGDREAVLAMMRVFYSSPAVHTNGSEEIFSADFEACVGENPYLDGYVFEEDGRVCGYAMTAKSFSTEFGKPCVWIEDLYLTEEYRDRGIGSSFFAFIEEKHPEAIFRLEVEEENGRAVHVYRKCGYEVLPYMEMKK